MVRFVAASNAFASFAVHPPQNAERSRFFCGWFRPRLSDSKAITAAFSRLRVRKRPDYLPKL
jgi:hypothetical protein